MYSAWNLTSEARTLLLEKLPPTFPVVVAHHVTHSMGGNQKPPAIGRVRVVGLGRCEDRGIEAVVVEIDGNWARPDGGLYHITLSRWEECRPFVSNQVLKEGWGRDFEPFWLDVFPAIND